MGEDHRVGDGRARTGLVITCEICLCIVAEENFDAHLHWHEIAASPMAHGLYVYGKIPRKEKA